MRDSLALLHLRLLLRWLGRPALEDERILDFENAEAAPLYSSMISTQNGQDGKLSEENDSLVRTLLIKSYHEVKRF